MTLGAGLASAQDSVSALKGHDSKAPIDLSADRAEAQDRADRAIFAGNVVVRQGSLTLRTARLTLAYASQDGIDINRIDASGGVTVTSPSETARGDFAVYDLEEGLITMVGNVRLERGGSFLSGGRLTIDLDTGRAVMDGGLRGVNQGGGGRVTGRFTVPQAQQQLAMNEAALFDSQLGRLGTAMRGLEVRSIAKSYDKRAVLHDVSLHVERGEVVGLLGPNGAGKTTSFYSVMGLVRPDAGRIFLDGRDITHLPMYRRAILGLGYLPQETSIFRGLTVEQNIMAVLEVAEPDQDAREARLEQAARGIRPDPLARIAGDGAVGRRAAALRNRPVAGRRAVDHAA